MNSSTFTKYRNSFDKIIAHSGFKKYFFNTSWVFAEKLIRLIAALFIGAYVARYLGPNKYGLLNYVISLVSIFTVFATLGLDSIVTRALIKDSTNKNEIIGTSLLLRIISSVLILLVLHLLITLTPTAPETTRLVYIIGSSSIFESFLVIDFYFQSQVRSKYSAWSQLSALILISIFRVLLIFYDAPLWSFAVAYSLDFFVIACGLLYFYHQKYVFLEWRFSYQKAKELMQLSWPLILAGVAVNLYMKFDQVMIHWMLGNDANGLYGVAVRLTEIWNFIPLVICNSLFPSIVNAQQLDENIYMKRLQMLFDLMVGLSIIIAIPMTFLSGFIMEILYGSLYKDAGPVLAIYIWSGVFVFLGVANSKWAINENLQKFQMVNMIVALIINLVLNYFLIKMIGLSGSAWATLISYSYAAYFSFLYSKKTRKIFHLSTNSLNLFGLINRAKKLLNTEYEFNA